MLVVFVRPGHACNKLYLSHPINLTTEACRADPELLQLRLKEHQDAFVDYLLLHRRYHKGSHEKVKNKRV